MDKLESQLKELGQLLEKAENDALKREKQNP